MNAELQYSNIKDIYIIADIHKIDITLLTI